MEKSSLVRPETGLPAWSVTTTSTMTRRTVVRRTVIPVSDPFLWDVPSCAAAETTEIEARIAMARIIGRQAYRTIVSTLVPQQTVRIISKVR